MKNKILSFASYKGAILLVILLIFIFCVTAFILLFLAFFIIPTYITQDSSELATITPESVTNTPTYTTKTCPQVPSNWRKGINDDFVDDQNFWFPGTYQDGTIDVNTQIANNLFQVDIRAQQGGFYSTKPYTNATAQDFYISLFARRVSGPTNSGYGITFRIIGDQLLFFRIDDSGLAQVHARDMDWNWLPTLLTNNQVINLNTEKTNQLVVFTQKDHYIFCVNNIIVGEIYDSNYPLGQFGIGVDLISAGDNSDFQVKLKNENGHAKFEFDNFIVYIPPKP